MIGRETRSFCSTASTISLLLLALACSGNSLKVGSDGKGGSDEGGKSSGGKGGFTAAAGAPNGGSMASRGGSGGASVATGGVSGDPIDASAGMGATPSITSCTDEFPFAGEWRGNVLDYFFEPMEEIRLSIRAEADGSYVGDFTWGTGDPPPPATDPNAPYPPTTDVFDGGGGGGFGSRQRWPGFPYTVVRGAGCDTVFRVSVSVAQTWESWCAIQPPIDNGTQGWGCMIRSTGGYGSDGVTCRVRDDRENVVAEYPAWRCELCGFTPVCVCSESGCTYNPEPTHSFDLTLSQSEGVDVLRGPDTSCSDCTVRLERVE